MKPSKKYTKLSKEDDPFQYHSKPSELANTVVTSANFDIPLKENKSSLYSEQTFNEVTFMSKTLVDHIQRPICDGGLGLSKLTRVQKAILPILCIESKEERKDMIIKSKTGSGKTLSYLIPMLNDLITRSPSVNRSEGTRCLIIAPSRELCSQIAEVLHTLTQSCVWIVGGSLTGGEKRKSEKARLRKGVIVVVATPGRLLDHLKTTESFTLTHLRWIIMDEVDRLLDMGFSQTILEILSIIHGTAMTGLNEKNRANFMDWQQKHQSNSIHQKYAHQMAIDAKKCRDPCHLAHLMVSATLSSSLHQLIQPIVQVKFDQDGASYLLVDADHDVVRTIRLESDFNALIQSKPSETMTSQGQRETMYQSQKVISFVEDPPTDSVDPSIDAPPGGMELLSPLDAPLQLFQHFIIVSSKWRLAALVSFLKSHSNEKVIVFFSTCDSVDFHSLLFHESVWPMEMDDSHWTPPDGVHHDSSSSNPSGPSAKPTIKSRPSPYLNPLKHKFVGLFGKETFMYRLHGNVPQSTRQLVFKEFILMDRGILLCTDVAARGLDLPKVDWIVQYDPPCETTDYIHRIGRTARKGLSGSSLLFVLPSESQFVDVLTKRGLRLEAGSLPSLFNAVLPHIPGADRFKNRDEMIGVILQRRMESTVHLNQVLNRVAQQAFRSFVRAYATHGGEMKGMFRIETLHLGHTAKSFGLIESPKQLRGNDDVIGKVFNGLCAAPDELGGVAGGKGGNESMPSKKRKKRLENASSSSDRPAKKKSRQGGIQRQQKVRTIGSKPNNSFHPSGKFRKSNGYFRKQLRSQTQSEFSHGKED